MPRPKAGKKAGSRQIIQSRPIVCVETGKLYMSGSECANDTGAMHCRDAAENL